MKFFKIKKEKGFTIVELVVSIGIFALMTTLLLAKYGSFNQGVLLTNLAYDVALLIRNAQSYGLNVKSAPTTNTNYSSEFNLPYGIYVNNGSTVPPTVPGAPPANLIPRDQIVFFLDKDKDGYYDKNESNPSLDETISVYNIKRGSYVHDVCVSIYYQCPIQPYYNLSITFVRPDVKAILKTSYANQPLKYAEITLRTSNGETKKISVNDFGQITIKD